MKTVNIHQAKTHLSRLVEEAARGDAFIIAKNGKPLVKVTPFESPEPTKRTFGFFAGEFKVPDDFDTMGADEIHRMFYGDE